MQSGPDARCVLTKIADYAPRIRTGRCRRKSFSPAPRTSGVLLHSTPAAPPLSSPTPRAFFLYCAFGVSGLHDDPRGIWRVAHVLPSPFCVAYTSTIRQSAPPHCSFWHASLSLLFLTSVYTSRRLALWGPCAVGRSEEGSRGQIAAILFGYDVSFCVLVSATNRERQDEINNMEI